MSQNKCGTEFIVDSPVFYEGAAGAYVLVCELPEIHEGNHRMGNISF